MAEAPSVSSHNLIQACAEPGCPLCRLSEKSVTLYLDALMYELVTDPDARDQIRASLGFCNPHAHHLIGMQGYALGSGIILRDVVNTVLGQLDSIKFAAPRGLPTHLVAEKLDRTKASAATEGAVHALTPQAPCPVCLQQDKMDNIAVTVLVDGLGNAELRKALENSAGVCLPHLRRALQLARSPQAFEALVALARRHYQALRAELDEFIRKNDYRFQNETMGAEGDSWKRAVAQMMGRPGTNDKMTR